MRKGHGRVPSKRCDPIMKGSCPFAKGSYPLTKGGPIQLSINQLIAIFSN